MSFGEVSEMSDYKRVKASEEPADVLRLESFLEREKLVGLVYTQIILSYLRKAERPSLEALGLDQKTKLILSGILESADEMFARQHEIATQTSVGSVELIAQLSGNNKLSGALEISKNKMRLDEPTPGLFILHIPANEFSKFGINGQAVAIKPKKGVYFIVVQEGYDLEFQKKYLEENLSHELSHLVWASAELKNLLPINETEDHFYEAFRMYRDELMARAVSGGALGGYTHIQKFNHEEREYSNKNWQKVFRQIQAKTESLNSFLRSVISPALQERDLSTSLIIEHVMISSNFSELQRNLEIIYQKIIQLPITRRLEPEKKGWESL